MTRNRILYLVLVIILAGAAALSGAAVGGVAVYQVMSQNKPAAVVSTAPVVQSQSASSKTPEPGYQSGG